MNPSFRILPLAPRHISPCAAILGESALFRRYGWTSTNARRRLTRALGDPAVRVYVAETRGAPRDVIGFAWVLAKGMFGRSPYLRVLAVRPEVQGRGAGARLLAHVERRHLGRRGLFLLVATTNRGARRFYLRHGYRRVGRLRDFVGRGRHEHIYFKCEK